MRIESAEFVRSAFGAGDLVHDERPEVAFVGRSNVGKSSLMNRLLGRKGLARTSSTPGRTRAVNYFLINGRFYFVDLPGYGYAKAGREERQRWARAVDAYFARAGDRTQLVMLVDAKVGATALDVQAAEFFGEMGLRYLVVATKIDRVPRSGRKRALAEIRESLKLEDETRLVPFSIRSGEGVKELWREIDLYLEREVRN